MCNLKTWLNWNCLHKEKRCSQNGCIVLQYSQRPLFWMFDFLISSQYFNSFYFWCTCVEQLAVLPAHLCPVEQWNQSCWTIADPWVMLQWMTRANRIEWILTLDWLPSHLQAKEQAWRINQSMISLLRPWMESRFHSVTTGVKCSSLSMLPPSEGQR